MQRLPADNELFRMRVAEYSSTVLRVAFSRLQNYADAEDVTQEVFASLYLYEKDFESEEHLKAWLIKVAINKCSDLKRSFWHRKTEPLSECALSIPFEEKDESVLQELKKLTPAYRDVIYLYYYEGYRIEEIASITQSNINTVSSRLKRARKKLGLLLTQAEHSDIGL